jgi:N-acyl-D-amino-acid deacylase
VRDGRIVFIGDASDAAAGAGRVVRRIDAGGLIVAPGFIDSHTHDDRALLSAPEMTPKSARE